jgi:hypothetical protein
MDITNPAAAEVSRRTLALVAQGMNPVEALRTVCGAAVVDRMIDDLYVALRGVTK